ncbi:unnamed protein product [Brassica rapa]|uniref:Uncharacterized protein n=2 Tax=Brassica TaxID=3705 RepID=A0A8D9I2C1_BRACM|nr:unnamed protein product [Brassica napus]CAG7908001.1 unnamed protein product [Brassica rapa]
MVDVIGLMQRCSLYLLFLHLSTFSAHYGSLRRFLLMNMWFLLLLHSLCTSAIWNEM